LKPVRLIFFASPLWRAVDEQNLFEQIIEAKRERFLRGEKSPDKMKMKTMVRTDFADPKRLVHPTGLEPVTF
jgi:hypothetical protein